MSENDKKSARIATEQSDNLTKYGNPKYRNPTTQAKDYAFKLAISEDKPILLDYWVYSLDKKAMIGKSDNGETLLIKSNDEYTSPVAKILRIETDLIVITANSIYIVDDKIPTKKISS